MGSARLLSVSLLVVVLVCWLVAPACGSGLAGDDKVEARTELSAGAEESRTAHLGGLDADHFDWGRVTDAQWKEWLTPLQYRVCRKAGTELPGTGELLYRYHKGDFYCSSCGELLFSAGTKYDSRTGWPSFWDIHEQGHVKVQMDFSLGRIRQEVVCSRCKAHLGHLFGDGPLPSGQRYCINSVCLFQQQEPAPAAPAEPPARENLQGAPQTPAVPPQ